MKLLCHQCHFTSQDHLCNVITLHEAQLFHVQSRKLVYVSTVAPSYATVLFLGEVTVLMLLKFFLTTTVNYRKLLKLCERSAERRYPVIEQPA